MKKIWIIIIAFVLTATVGVTAFAVVQKERRVKTVVCYDTEASSFGESDCKIEETQVKNETKTETKTKTETETETETQTSVNNESTENFTEPKQNDIDKLKAKNGIDDTYQEKISESIDGYTEYCYTKIDKNGIANPYDSLKVTIDNTTGEIFTSKRFDKAAYIEAKLDEKTAKEKAAEAHPKTSVEKCELEYFMPDYPNGEVLLVYRTEFKDGNIVYVNAVSGDIAQTEQLK